MERDAHTRLVQIASISNYSSLEPISHTAWSHVVLKLMNIQEVLAPEADISHVYTTDAADE